MVLGLSWWLSGKNPSASVGDEGSTPGSGSFSGRRKWQPTPVFLPGKSHGQRGLEGYSPWVPKESGMTEQLNNKMILTLMVNVEMNAWMHL